MPGADTDVVWRAVSARVRGHLDEQGAGPVTLHRSAEPPERHPRSGKYAQVINLLERPSGV